MNGWHGRAHAETPGLVRSSADDRAPAQPGNDHGLAAQLRIIALLDRSIKRVHVDMDDFSHNLLATYYSGSPNTGNVYQADPAGVFVMASAVPRIPRSAP